MSNAAALLPRVIGQTERALGAILEPLLTRAGLSFPEWTTLLFVDAPQPLAAAELVDRLVASRIATRDCAEAALERLRSAGLLTTAADGSGMALTEAGEAVFRPVRRSVSEITEALFSELPRGDLDATHRTLTEVTRRATAHIAAS
jgi:hypothetical protein